MRESAMAMHVSQFRAVGVSVLVGMLINLRVDIEMLIDVHVILFSSTPGSAPIEYEQSP